MQSGPTLKAKVNVKLGSSTSKPSSSPRPVSPTKSSSSLDSRTAFRPKAKVNNSATSRLAKVASSTSSTPRSGSPTKLAPRVVRNGVAHTPKAPSLSAPVTPELRTRSLTKAAEDSAPQRAAVHLADMSGTVSSPGLMPTVLMDRELSSSPTLRIRSKVSTMAKLADSLSVSPSSGLSSSPAHRSSSFRTRTPSVSSMASQPTSPPLPQFYPITTAAPAANPHRYASIRPPPSRTIQHTASQIFQSSAPRPSPADNSPPSKNRFGSIQAKVDPNLVPLPSPHSPPMSASSFSSSRSSVSRSPASISVVDDRPGSQSTSTASSHLQSPTTKRNGSIDHHLSATLDGLIHYTSTLPSAEDSAGGTDEEALEEDEHQVKAAAKSNRKIADLEITNRSLLAINATLEATKHRQAKEIRELKRKLRESRLILPPRAYRAIKSSPEIAGDDDDEEEEEDGDDDKEQNINERDGVYQRIEMLIDNLLKTGQRALEKQVEDFPEGGKGGAKVLTAEEVRDWHQWTDGSNDDLHDHDHDTIHDNHNGNNFNSQVDMCAEADALLEDHIEGNKSWTASEAEVEAMMIPSPSTTPPIFITKPS